MTLLRRSREHWPLAVALTIFALATAFLAARSWQAAGGRLLYTYDDAWIQLAIAKNLVHHGLWGVSPHGFASASSSPLWCLLLAGGFALAGVHEHLAFGFNLLAAAGVLIAAEAILCRQRVAAGWRAAVLLGLTAAAPLVGIVFVGLEHALHSLLSLAFLYLAAEELADPSPDSSPAHRRPWWLPLLALLLPICRYEGLAALALVGLLLAVRRRFARAAIVLACGLAPVVAFGLLSRAAGWHFLPNSILVKAGILDTAPSSFLVPFRVVDFDKLWKHPTLITLLAAAGFLLTRRLERERTPWRVPSLLLLFTLLLILAHERYGALGFLFRYEVYLLVLGLVALGVALFAGGPGPRETLRQTPWPVALCGGLLAIFLLLPFAGRAKEGTFEALHGGRDRLVEHVIPAEWIHERENGSTVVLNDIGAVSFFSDAKSLDLVGLASREPLGFSGGPGGYTARKVARWARQQNARLAITTAPWSLIERLTPPEWVPLAAIRLPEDVVYGNRRVMIHACKPEDVPALKQEIEQGLVPRYAALGIEVRVF